MLHTHVQIEPSYWTDQALPVFRSGGQLNREPSDPCQDNQLTCHNLWHKYSIPLQLIRIALYIETEILTKFTQDPSPSEILCNPGSQRVTLGLVFDRAYNHGALASENNLTVSTAHHKPGVTVRRTFILTILQNIPVFFNLRALQDSTV